MTHPGGEVRRIVERTALIGVGLCSAAILGEISLRLSSRQATEYSTQTQGEKLMEQDPLVGWRPRRGYREERVDPGGTPYVLRVNATGTRGGEVALGGGFGRRRVLILGDSFTMATDFAEEDIFVGHVSRILRAQAPETVEVINGGVNGYGTHDELKFYHHYGRQLQPDVVLLCFYTGNDLRDNMISTSQGRRLDPLVFGDPLKYRHAPDVSPRLEHAGQVLSDPLSGRPVPRPHGAWAEALQRRFLLARLVGSRLSHLVGKWRGDLTAVDIDGLYHFYEFGFFQGRDDGVFRRAREFTLDCLQQLHRTAESDGAEFIVFLLPSDLQVDPSQRRRVLKDLGVEDDALGTLDPWYVNQFLADFCSARSIPYFDLGPAFSAWQSPAELYQVARGDRHFSAAGHRLAGRMIAEFLLTDSARLRDPAVDSYRVARSSIDGNDIEAAEAALRDGIRQSPEWPSLRRALGDVLRRQGRFSEGIREYEAALAATPERSGTHAALGDTYLAMADTAAAIHAYANAVRIRPSALVQREKIHHLYRKQNKAPEAEVESGAVEDFLAAKWSSAQRIKLAESFFGAGMEAGDDQLASRLFDRAATVFSTVLEAQPDDVASLNNLASIYMLTGRDGDAVTLLEKAVGIDPQLATASYNLGMIYARAGAETKAIEHYRRAVTLEPDAQTYSELGNLYVSAGQLRDAAGAYRHASLLAPLELKYLYNLGVVLAALGERMSVAGKSVESHDLWAEARDVFSKVVKVAPGYMEARSKLDQLELVLGG